MMEVRGGGDWPGEGEMSTVMAVVSISFAKGSSSVSKILLSFLPFLPTCSA